jgi:thiamine transport system permease protein
MSRARRPKAARIRHVALVAAVAAVPVLVLVVFFGIPVLAMLQRGFFSDGHLDLAGAMETLTSPRVLHAIWFTVWTSALGTALAVALGVPTAHLVYRREFPGRTLLRALVTVPFVLPTVVVGAAFRTLLTSSGPLGALGLDGTPAAIVVALVFFNISVVVRTVGPWWAGVDPRRGDAAAALGASPAQVFRTVTLPALRPAVISSASVVFLFCATAFGIVLTLGGVHYSTVETQIYLLTTQLLDLRAAAALSVLQIVAVVTLLALAGRAQSRRVATVAREGRSTTTRRPARSDLPALAVAFLVVVLVTLPMAALVVRSLQVDGAWSLANYRALQSPQGNTLVPVTTAVSTSLRIAVDVMLFALTLGLMVAVLVTRRPRTRLGRRAMGVFDGLFMLPLGVSAVSVGFGLLVTLDRPPLDLRASPWLVPIAQTMVALPLVVRVIVPALRSVPQRQREAAATLGAGPLRSFLTVELSAAWRSVLAAAGLAFAVSLGEFGATSFLVRPDNPTLPVVIFSLLARPTPGSFGVALAASVVLAVLTAGVAAAVERVRGGWIGGF